MAHHGHEPALSLVALRKDEWKGGLASQPSLPLPTFLTAFFKADADFRVFFASYRT